MSGYVDGQPVYSTIRVVPEDVVARIEGEISLQEKMEYKPQASDLTLFEWNIDPTCNNAILAYQPKFVRTFAHSKHSLK